MPDAVLAGFSLMTQHILFSLDMKARLIMQLD